MGHAARSKQRALANGDTCVRGNPEPTVLMVRYLERDRLALEYFETKRRYVPVRFSDRGYLVDAVTGQIRRLALPVPSAPKPPDAHPEGGS